MTLTAGTTLQNGRYVIHSVVHRGDVDITYDATHTYLDQAVHIKTLQDRFRPQFEDVQLRQEFTQRAASFAQCTNPHLVRVLDGFEEDWMPFLVLKQIPGQSLASVLTAKGQEAGLSSPLYTPDEVRCILRQVMSAVQSLHDQHLVHGAIAPQSLLLRNETQDIVLAELGFRSLLPSLQNPETAWLPLSPQDDLRGVATTLYALLTGDLKESQALMQQPSFIELSQIHPSLYPDLESVLIQGLNAGDGELIDEWFRRADAVLTGQPLNRDSRIEAALDVSPLPENTVQSSVDSSLESAGLPQMPLPPSIPQPQLKPSPLQETPTYQAPATSSDLSQTAATVVVAPAAASQRQTPKTTIAPVQSRPSKKPAATWRLPMAMGLTSVVAALTGGYLGLSFRLQETEQLEQSPIFGNEIFGTDQTFPTSDAWPGESDYDGQPKNLLFERPNSNSTYDEPSNLDSQILASPELLDSETAPPDPDYTFQDDVQFDAEPDDTWDWDSVPADGGVSPVAPAKEPPAEPVETAPPPVAPPPSGSSGTVPPSVIPEPAPSPTPQVNEVPRSPEAEPLKAPASGTPNAG